MLCWLSSRIFLEWTCCARTRRAHSHSTSSLSSRSFRSVRLQSKCCCPLHCWLLSAPRTQRMSLTRCCLSASRKCRLIWAVTRLIYSPFDPAVKTTESIVSGCCHNHAETKADVDARVFSHSERGVRCLGIASSRLQIRFVLDKLDVIARASKLDPAIFLVKMI